MQSVQEIVRDAEDNYLNGSIKMSEYVDFDMHKVIERIDAYLNSVHISGDQDSLGRDKPFFDIVTAATNIWYRATDIDRKDVRIVPDRQSHTAHAFIATVILQDWMKTSRFGMFLNEWGRSLARYGSSVVKFVEKDGQLYASVIPWNRLIVDPIDFDAIPTIEKIYRTPEQLKQSNYDKEKVNELIDAQVPRETLDDEQKDNQDKFIELYEVHGRMPEALLLDDPNEATEAQWENYVQQMHVVSFTAESKDSYKDFTLYKGRESKHPYMITHLIKEDGRTLSIGAVEHLFHAQWMVNHSMKNVKDTLDLASKLIFQTADSAYAGRNVLTAIETGQIMIHSDNRPLTRIANDKPDITAFQNFAQQWQGIASEITSTPDAMKGNTLPSGTPYSLGAYLGSQANSLFEIMTENKGLYLEDMMREFVLPFVVKKMNTKEEITAILDEHAIEEVDAMYVPREAVRRHNEEAKRRMIEGEIPSPFQQDMEEDRVRQSLAQMGNRRGFSPDELGEKSWKDALDGFVKKVVVEVTNENVDKQAVLTTLSSLLQTIAGNPQILQDPNAKMIFSAILTETGRISPMQIRTTQTASPPQQGGESDALQALSQQTNNV